MALINKIINIADAIREKTNTTSKLTLDDMVGAIDNITTGFPNGTKWTESNLALEEFLLSDLHNDIWVASSQNGKGIYYSEDGKTWTQSNIKTGTYSEASYYDGIWVAGNSRANTENGIYYSEDGKTWVQSNITRVRVPVKAEYINNRWIIRADEGIYSSIDGKIWDKLSLNVADCPDIMYSNGIWFIQSHATSVYLNGLFYSTDFENWTRINNSMRYGGLPVYGNNIWVVSGVTSDDGLLYSRDGITWTKSNVVTGRFDTIMYIDGVWMAGGDDIKNHHIYYSTDGITWSESRTDDGIILGYDFNFLGKHKGLWFIGTRINSSNEYSSIYYSRDGITWMKSNFTGGVAYTISYNGLILIAATSIGLYYSLDGTTWTVADLRAPAIHKSKVTYRDCIWVTSVSTGILYSVTWEPSEELLGGV